MRKLTSLHRPAWARYPVLGAIGLLAGSLPASAAVVASGNTFPSAGSSFWNSGGSLSSYVAIADVSAGTLSVTSGSLLQSGSATVGNNAGATGSVGISGSGARWLSSGAITIGSAGNATFQISRGGYVQAANGAVIASAGSSVASLTISGSGSEWYSPNGGIFVGRDGQGSLTVSGGANLTSYNASIGHGIYLETGSGSASVGNGGSWINQGNLDVGYNTQGSLNIGSGGLVNVGQTTRLGQRIGLGGSGEIHFDGGTLMTLTLNAELSDLHGSGNLVAAGLVTGSPVLADFDGSNHTQFTVDNGRGDNIQLDLTADGSGTLGVDTLVRNGAQISANATLGAIAGDIHHATVTGPGSSWTAPDLFSVAGRGTATVEILDGASVTSRRGSIAGGFNGTGDVVVSGEGSSWSVTGDWLEIARETDSTGSLTVNQGGRVHATGVQMAGSSGATAFLNVGSESGAAATAPGIIDAPWVRSYGSVVFNHSGTDYHFTRTGTSDGADVILAWGTVVRHEAGVTALSGDNLHSGDTLVIGGELRLANLTGSATGTGDVRVEGGTLRLSGNNISDLSSLEIHPAGTLALDGNETVGDARISGHVLGDGTLTASAYHLGDGAVIDGSLGEGVFDMTQGGDVIVRGKLGSDEIHVPAGLLVLSGGNLEESAALSTGASGIVRLDGNQTVDRYTAAGGLAGAGLLTATSGAMLGDGAVLSGHLNGSTITRGEVFVDGSVRGDTLAVEDGTLQVAGRLLSGEVSIGSSAMLVEFGDASLSALSRVTNAGTLFINGWEAVSRYVNQAGASLMLNVAGMGASDHLTSDSVVLEPGSTLKLASSELGVGERADILDGPIVGSFDLIVALGGSGAAWRYTFNPADGTIQALPGVAVFPGSGHRLFNLSGNRTQVIGSAFEDAYLDPADGGTNFRTLYFREVDPGNPDPTLRWMPIPAAEATAGDLASLDLDPGLGLVPTAPGSPERRLGDAITAFQASYRSATNAEGQTVTLVGPAGLMIADMLSPAVHRGMADRTEQSMLSHLGAARSAEALGPVGKKGEVFAMTHVSKGGGADDYDLSVAAITAGVRYQLTPRVSVGAFHGVDEGGVRGALVDSDARGCVTGLEAEVILDPVSETAVFGGLAYTHQQYDTTRTSFGGRAGAEDVDADGWAATLGLETLAFRRDALRVRPRAMIRYLNGDVDGFTERGSGVNLQVGATDFESLLLEVGVQVEYQPVGHTTLVGSVGYVAELTDSSATTTARYVGGATPFAVSTVGADLDALAIGLGAWRQVTPGFRFGANWRSEFRPSSSDLHWVGIGGSLAF